MEMKHLYLLAVIIVVGLIGWALFLFTNITGQTFLQFEEIPSVDPFYMPWEKFETLPDEERRLSPNEVPINECDNAKIARNFVCGKWEDKYGGKCNVFGFGCKAIWELCVESQRIVEEECKVDVG